MNALHIRKATAAEIAWINEKYAEVDFKESVFENELIAIAVYDNTSCGLGRMVKIDEQNYELGGMYVFQEFRNKGIAEKIVAFLLANENSNPINIWCLPFENLKDFYAKFGFKLAEESNIPIPKEIAEKHQWCNNTYEKKVLLMVKEQ